MRKVSEYREHAAECRKLALSLDGEPRDQLLKMAETWDQLADERERTAALIEAEPKR